MACSEELPGVVVPAAVFVGVVGVAPSQASVGMFRLREQEIADRGGSVAESMPERAFPAVAVAGPRTIPPRETGGNMIIRVLVAGSRLFLSVHVQGALFSIGDLHFAQGDGEVCRTGIEVAVAATVRFEVRENPGRRPRSPAYETPDRAVPRSFATTGIPVRDPMELSVAAREALLEMIGYRESTHGLARPAACVLCSTVVDLHITEVVDVIYPLVSALVPLDIFASTSSAAPRTTASGHRSRHAA